MIKTIIYSLRYAEGVDYENAPIQEGEFQDFHVSLNKNEIIFEFKNVISTLEEAKEKVSIFLRNWEIFICLEAGPDEIKFIFRAAEKGDDQEEGISPSDLKTNIKRVKLSEVVIIKDSMIAHISRGKFPSYPKRFARSPDVDSMYYRYKGYRLGRENLTTMGYFCLTVLEVSAGSYPGNEKLNKREKAAVKYKVEKNVLDVLGKLCSKKGDVNQARKAPENGYYDPLKPMERKWIDEVIKKLILRTGEYAYNPTTDLPLITISNFPSLPPN